MGRETFLLPLEWKDGWPRFLDRGEAVPMVLPKPGLKAGEQSDWARWRDDFDKPLSSEWIGLRTPGEKSLVSIDPAAAELRVVAGPAAAGSLGKPAFVGRRLRHHKADITTRLDFAPQRSADFAGLLAFMDEHHFLAAGKERGRVVVRLRTSASEGNSGVIIAEQALTSEGPIELKMALDGGSARVFWREAGQEAWVPVGETINVERLASVYAGLFTGLVVGPYAYSPG